jgi:hypothetical protein
VRPKFLTQKEWFELVVRDLLDAGLAPTPSRLEPFDASFVTRKGTNITLSHGRLNNIKRALLKEYGWWQADSKWSNGRWHKPLICDTCGDTISGPSFREHNERNYERHVRLSHTSTDAERILGEYAERYSSM